MVVRAHTPLDPARRGVLFYLHTRDLEGLQTHVLAHGSQPGQSETARPARARRFACVTRTATCSWSPSATRTELGPIDLLADRA